MICVTYPIFLPSCYRADRRAIVRQTRVARKSYALETIRRGNSCAAVTRALRTSATVMHATSRVETSMPKRSNVLIVSASAGAGHMRAAEALRENFVAQSRRGWTEHVDILELAPRWVRHAYGGGFELVAAHAPWMWRELYSLTDGRHSDLARWGPLAERLLFRAFRRLAENGDWDLILCTHFLPCQLTARRRDLPPFALVVT